MLCAFGLLLLLLSKFYRGLFSDATTQSKMPHILVYLQIEPCIFRKINNCCLKSYIKTTLLYTKFCSLGGGLFWNVFVLVSVLISKTYSGLGLKACGLDYIFGCNLYRFFVFIFIFNCFAFYLLK